MDIGRRLSSSVACPRGAERRSSSSVACPRGAGERLSESDFEGRLLEWCGQEIEHEEQVSEYKVLRGRH